MRSDSRSDERDQIDARAREVLGEAAEDWMQTWNQALGCAPADLLRSEEGAKRVLRVLGRIEHGVVS